jgi:hypothetical protein
VIIHIIHHVEVDWDLPDTKVRAYCGAEAVVKPSADVVPEDFDFVFEENPKRQSVATCEACKKAAKT